MRLGLLLRRIPFREAMSGGPIDVEWLLDRLEAGDELFIHVDEDGPGVAALRHVGVAVDISPKRVVDVDGRLTSDALAARRLGAAHRDAPIDRIIVGGDVANDPRWLCEELRDVPILVTLGEIPHRLAPLAADRDAAQRYLPATWAASGALATADAILGSAPPSSYGLADLDAIPRVAPGPGAVIATSVPDEPRLVVFCITSASTSELVEALTRLADEISVTPATTIVCVVSRPMPEGDDPGALMMLGAPSGLAEQTVVAAVDDDGVASAFLAGADLIVAHGLADLAVPAVAARSIDCPTVLLADPTSTNPATAWEAYVELRSLAESAPELIPVDGGLKAAADQMSRSAAPGFILHTPAGAPLALHLHGRRLPPGADITMVCQADAVQGTARPERPVPTVVGVDARSARMAAHVLADCDDFSTFVSIILDPANAARLHLRLLPAPIGTRASDAAAPPDGVPQWHGSGPLPRASSLRMVRIEAPERRHMGTTSDDASMRRWVKQHRWTDRVRLALPWKGGLLQKAMKDRW